MALVYVDGESRDEYALDLGARIFADRARARGIRVDHEEFDGVRGDSGPRYDGMIPRLLAGPGSPVRRRVPRRTPARGKIAADSRRGEAPECGTDARCTERRRLPATSKSKKRSAGPKAT
jgi:hypothetical protein